MKHSEQINEIAADLAVAQRLMNGAKKDSANPFFKSKYADLASVAGACLDQLNDNGIAVVQAPATLDDGRVSVETMLLHSSGQWMAETLIGKPKDDGPQALGSVITYLRRYALAAFAGVAPEDDDGNAAEGRPKGFVVEARPVSAPSETVNEQTGEVTAIAPDTKTEHGAAYHWIVRCEDHLGRAGKKKATITFTDGTAATIWKPGDQLLAVCVDLMQKVARVVPTFQFKEGYAPTLKAIKAYQGDEDAQEESREQPPDIVPPIAVDDSSIPF